ncbi:MAG: MipA/OmpV family protein, partial [Candidatus Aureabacteria bacterium]|nr:MipA/OmpV family protein [Candidatus Auribacterota bacterium]
LRAATDALDKTGGNTAKIQLSKSFQAGSVRLTPNLALNWQDSTLSNYEYGVPAANATKDRPFYHLNDTLSHETGFNAMIELPRNWSFVFQFGAELLDEAVTDSPLINKDYVFKGFMALSCKV